MPEARMAPARPPRSFAGPIILILLGVVCLMGTMHMISGPRLLWLFSRYWPLLIILWGGIKLVEYYQARHSGTDAPRIGAGSIILVIFLVMIGMTATGASRMNWGAINDNVQLDEGDDEVINFLGGKTFTYDTEKVADINEATSLRVNSNRGGITVLTWDEPRVKVVTHKKVIASSEEDAKKLDASTQPTINVAGSLVTVDTNTNVESRVVIFGDIRFVRTDVDVYVPKKLAAQIDTRHGDVTVRDRTGEVRVSDQHGAITLENISANVTVDLSHGDLKATNVNGDVNVSGRLDDTTLADVSGAAHFSGEFFGEMNLSKIAKGVTFRSSRTDMTLARLDGDLTLQSSDLKVKSVVGPFRLTTRAKDIHLEDINGDVEVQNTNGVVEIASTKPGKISVENRNNDVILTLPAKAAFQYSVKARQGEISSDFPDFQINNEHRDNTANGSIGSGGPRVEVTNQHGNVEIRKS